MPGGAAAFAAALAFEQDYYARAATTAVAHPLGLALGGPEVPRAHMLNMLWVTTRSATPTAVLAALEQTQGDLAHRKAEVADDTLGAALAAPVRDAGYSTKRFVWMARHRPHDRAPVGGLARETDAASHTMVEAATTAELPHGGERAVVDQLAEARARLRGAATTRYFVASADGVDAAHATLVAGDGVAQLEDVGTLEAHRRRGLARAVCTTAVDAATAGTLVFVVAEADDWPRELYAKLGFDAVGHTWAFVKDPA